MILLKLQLMSETCKMNITRQANSKKSPSGEFNIDIGRVQSQPNSTTIVKYLHNFMVLQSNVKTTISIYTYSHRPKYTFVGTKKMSCQFDCNL